MPLDNGTKPSQSDKSTPSISLYDFFSLLVEKRRMIAACLAVVILPALLMLLLTPNQYRSTATILPSKKVDNLDNLKAVAGLFGSPIQTEGTPELFPVVLRSRLIADAVVHHDYRLTLDGVDSSFTLVDYFDTDNRDLQYAALKKITEISKDKETGYITVAVETEHPELSQAIVGQYLAELERYNIHSRMTKAKRKEGYLSREVAAREKLLLAAQDSLRIFQEGHRNWASTDNPAILSDLSRLKRDVAILEQNFLYLTKEHEAAKLEVQLDTPVITILDQPSLPELKSGPYRLTILMALTVMTMLVTVMVIAVAEGMRREIRESRSGSYARFRDNVQTAFPTTTKLVLKARHDWIPQLSRPRKPKEPTHSG